MAPILVATLLFFLACRSDAIPSSPQLIISLGGGNGERFNYALTLRETLHNRALMLATGATTLSPTGHQQAHDFRYYVALEHNNTPLTLDYGRYNTNEELKRIKTFMLTHHLHRAIIVTEQLHIARVRYLLHLHCFREANIQMYLIAAKHSSKESFMASLTIKRLQFIVAEVMKIVYYFIINLFHKDCSHYANE